MFNKRRIRETLWKLINSDELIDVEDLRSRPSPGREEGLERTWHIQINHRVIGTSTNISTVLTGL